MNIYKGLSVDEKAELRSVILDCGLMIELASYCNTQDYRCYLVEKALLSSKKLSKIFTSLINYSDSVFNSVVSKVVSY